MSTQTNNGLSEPRSTPWRQAAIVVAAVIATLAIGTLFEGAPSESLQLERDRLLSYEKHSSLHNRDRNELYRGMLASSTTAIKNADTPMERASALLQRALAYHRLNDDDHALADLNAIISNPKSGTESILEALMTRGGINWLRGDYQKAISDYDAIPYSWEDYSAIQIAKGMVYLRWGKPDRALPIFDGLIAALPVTCTRMRSMLESSGPHSVADRAMIAKEMLSICGQLAAYEYAGRATARRELGNYRGALADYKIAIEHDPYSAELAGREAQTYFMLGDFNDAVKGYWHRMVLAFGSRPKQRWQ